MAIEDTLKSVKDYFLNWHKDNYTTLHNPISDTVTNTEPKKNQAVTSEAVYNALNQKFNEVNTCTVKQCNTKPAPTGSLQSTLDDFNTQINNISNTIQPTTPDYTYFDDIGNAFRDHPNQYADIDKRGFKWPPLPDTAKAGFMTPEDKMNLYYATSWWELTGKQIGTNTTLTNHLTIWVNYGLRLVYCSFGYKECPWLKNAYNKKGATTQEKKQYVGKPYKNENEFFYFIRPYQNIWTPTNLDGVKIGVTASDGEFYIRSDHYVTNSPTINGSLMWFYRDAKPSFKLE